jgi:branched-chain amino acid aminotransferase
MKVLENAAQMPPLGELGFGKFFAPLMATAEYRDGAWHSSQIVKTQDLDLSPASKVLHYGQEVFEGLKVFRSNKGLSLFRPDRNIQRMAASAEILAMPPVPADLYLKALKDLSRQLESFVPPEPGALYLRPTLIGTTPTLGVQSASEFLFFVLASPVGGYFGDLKLERPASIDVLVTKKYVRAVRGGLGRAKTAANYAASLRAVSEAKKQGFANILFLDAIHQSDLEELSGMNVFVVEGGTLKTPRLGDTILEGVTRDTILALARASGIRCEESTISMSQLIRGLETGLVTELFACGTASSVTSITQLGWDGKRLKVGNGEPGELSTRLFRMLTDTQYGRLNPLDSQWIVPLG